MVVEALKFHRNGGYARDGVHAHTLLSVISIVESLADEDAHLIDGSPGGHLLQLLHLIHTCIDESLSVLMSIHHTLVEYGIGKVVDEYLYADVGRSRVLRLGLVGWILALPLRLTQSVGLVGLLDVGEDDVDRFLDGSLAHAHGGYSPSFPRKHA